VLQLEAVQKARMALKKRFTSLLSGKKNPFERNRSDLDVSSVEGDTPEANIARGVKSFCESGGSDSEVNIATSTFPPHKS